MGWNLRVFRRNLCGIRAEAGVADLEGCMRACLMQARRSKSPSKGSIFRLQHDRQRQRQRLPMFTLTARQNVGKQCLVYPDKCR